jgi:hypothetical protein
MENKLHHMLHPDVMYYGSRMVQVSPLDHDGKQGKLGNAPLLSAFPVRW